MNTNVCDTSTDSHACFVIVDLVLEQLGYDLEEGVKGRPIIGDIDRQDNDEDDHLHSPSPSKKMKIMKTPTPSKKPPSGRSSSSKKGLSVLTATTTPTDRSEDPDDYEAEVNELLPRVLEQDDNEHLFVTGFPLVYGHTNTNRRFVFDDDGMRLRMEVAISKDLRTAHDLLEGYDGCGEGSQWLRFMQLAVKRLYGGKDPKTPGGKHVFKTMFFVDLPYEVEKKFFKTKLGGIVEIKAPMMQSNGSFGWFSCYLKKKHVEETAQDGKETEAVGKGLDLLMKIQGLVVCKWMESV